MTTFMILLFRGLLQLIPMLFAKSAKREEYERLIKEGIKSWEQQAGRAAKVRKDHEAVNDELNQRYNEKWPDSPRK